MLTATLALSTPCNRHLVSGHHQAVSQNCSGRARTTRLPSGLISTGQGVSRNARRKNLHSCRAAVSTAHVKTLGDTFEVSVVNSGDEEVAEPIAVRRTKFAPPDADWVPAIGLIVFALGYLGLAVVDFPHLFLAFASCAALQCLALVMFGKTDFDMVRCVVAPAVLAARALSPAGDPGNFALGIFGLNLSVDLELPSTFGWASLAMALTLGQGPMWMAIAVALNHGFRIVRGLYAREQMVPLVSLPVILVTLFAFQHRSHELWVISLGFGECVRSFIGLVKYIRDKRPSAGLVQKFEELCDDATA